MDALAHILLSISGLELYSMFGLRPLTANWEISQYLNISNFRLCGDNFGKSKVLKKLVFNLVLQNINGPHQKSVIAFELENLWLPGTCLRPLGYHDIPRKGFLGSTGSCIGS